MLREKSCSPRYLRFPRPVNVVERLSEEVVGGIKGEWKGLGRVLRGCGRRWKGVEGGGGGQEGVVVLLAPLIAFSSPR